MDYKLILRNITLGEEDKNFLEKNLQKLKKITKNIKGKKIIWIELEKSKHHKKGPFIKAIIDIRLKKKSLRSESVNKNIQLSLKEAFKEVIVELKKYKEKNISKSKRQIRKIKENF